MRDEGATLLRSNRVPTAQRAFAHYDFAIVQWFEPACRLGYRDGCREARKLRSTSEYGVLDPGAARAFFERENLPATDVDCTQPRIDACYNLGMAYLDQKYGAVDAVTGERLLGGACEAGHAMSCDWLGGRHHTGGRFQAARDAFELGCQLGHADSCRKRTEIDNFVRSSNESARRESEYRRQLTIACGNGSEESCRRLRALPNPN